VAAVNRRCAVAMAGRGRGRGGRGGRGPVGELLRDVGEDLWLQSLEGGAPEDAWPAAGLPVVRPITDAERDQITSFRALARTTRSAVGFGLLRRAALASSGLTDDGLAKPGDFGAVDVAPFVDDIGAARASLRRCLPAELLKTPRARAARAPPGPKPPRAPKRPRAASDAAALAEKLAATEGRETEDAAAPRPAHADGDGDGDAAAAAEDDLEEDEPDDYMRDYYDEDNDALDGDDQEPIF